MLYTCPGGAAISDVTARGQGKVIISAQNEVLAAALGFGLAYLAFCYRDASPIRALIKTTSVALLGVCAALEGAPGLLIAGLGLSALGDAFLAGKAERWLKPGMAAFFAAHVAYAVLFWTLGADAAANRAYGVTGPLLLATLTLFYLRFLRPSLGDMKVPVFIYALAILIMGALALRLLPEGRLVAIGALLFILSDAILAHELFKAKDGVKRILPSLAVWSTYFAAQVLILFGVLRLA